MSVTCRGWVMVDRLYAVQDARRRVVVRARDAGMARLAAAAALYGRPDAEERDRLQIGDVEPEEEDEFDSRCRAAGA